MTGIRPPEHGDTEPVRFVDPLTGRPLYPDEPLTEELMAALGPPVRHASPEPGRIALSVVGAGALLSVFLLLIVFSLGEPASAPPVRPVAAPATGSPPPVRPSIIGWRPVVSGDHPFAFDVPPDWTVEDPGTVLDYQDPNGQFVSLHGVARFKGGFCPTLDVSARAQTGFTTLPGSRAPGPAEAAKETAMHWADAAFSSPDGATHPRITVGAAVPVRVFHGTVQAMRVDATVRPAARTECGAPSVLITAVALPLDAGQYSVHLILADQEVDNAMPAEETDEIVGSIRLATS